MIPSSRAFRCRAHPFGNQPDNSSLAPRLKRRSLWFRLPASSGVLFWSNLCRQCGCESSLTSPRNQGLAAMRTLATGFDHAVVIRRQFSQKGEGLSLGAFRLQALRQKVVPTRHRRRPAKLGRRGRYCVEGLIAPRGDAKLTDLLQLSQQPRNIPRPPPLRPARAGCPRPQPASHRGPAPKLHPNTSPKTPRRTQCWLQATVRTPCVWHARSCRQGASATGRPPSPVSQGGRGPLPAARAAAHGGRCRVRDELMKPASGSRFNGG
jgi:hypothetical protein